MLVSEKHLVIDVVVQSQSVTQDKFLPGGDGDPMIRLQCMYSVAQCMIKISSRTMDLDFPAAIGIIGPCIILARCGWEEILHRRKFPSLDSFFFLSFCGMLPSSSGCDISIPPQP